MNNEQYETDQKNKGDGFYEVFSDLIFATMAIFVLLFIVIITQVKPDNTKSFEFDKGVDLVVAIDLSPLAPAFISNYKLLR